MLYVETYKNMYSTYFLNILVSFATITNCHDSYFSFIRSNQTTRFTIPTTIDMSFLRRVHFDVILYLDGSIHDIIMVIIPSLIVKLLEIF